MSDQSTATGEEVQIRIINEFLDQGDDVIYYHEQPGKRNRGVISIDRKRKKVGWNEDSLLVVTAMEKQTMSDTKVTYIDYSKLDPDYFEIDFNRVDDVIWMAKDKKIWIPTNVTHWAFKVTPKKNAPLPPDTVQHTVTVGEEKPGY